MCLTDVALVMILHAEPAEEILQGAIRGNSAYVDANLAEDRPFWAVVSAVSMLWLKSPPAWLEMLFKVVEKVGKNVPRALAWITG